MDPDLERVQKARVSSESGPPSHLRLLEAEAVHVIREVAAEMSNPVLLFSAGKDSIVLLHLAAKAFWPLPVPFPILHVDTGHNFPEVLRFRDDHLARNGHRLIIASVQDSIDSGRVREFIPGGSRNRLQTRTLLDALATHRFDAAFGGARRDEERSRAKERVVSVRDAEGQWDPRRQRPEIWSLYNCKVLPNEHVRVFPLSNWTELDVWNYIALERISLPSIYFAHERAVVNRDGMLLAVTKLTPAQPGEHVDSLTVRYRTVGDLTITGAVCSTASHVDEVIAELQGSTISERGATRADDRVSSSAMEDRKREGYF